VCVKTAIAHVDSLSIRWCRAAGICSVDGNIIIDDAIVTADAVSKSAVAAGIYSEYGDVEITSTRTVTATGKSQGGDANESQGLGIAAGSIFSAASHI
jgi:hypothetical protein